MAPVEVLRCFMSLAEIDLVRSSIGHDAQTTVSDPQLDSGELNPDGSVRPPLSAEQIGALVKMQVAVKLAARTPGVPGRLKT